MKIDFHIHTVKNTFLDRQFVFDKEMMKEYVKSNCLDAVAITNHNLFDAANFAAIVNALSGINCVVFPGIEISLETGHILVVFDNTQTNIGILKNISSFIQSQETDDHYSMSVTDFNTLCCGKGALIIPHYEKTPKINKVTINRISDDIYAGEVDSPKKFYKMKKNGEELTPVYFSDIRIGESEEIEDYRNKSRFSYVDCETATFKSITTSIKNNDVYLSKRKIPDEFDILNGSASASTGINVLIGKRSSGKTYTLNHIMESYSNNCLYIKQFEITNHCGDNEFKNAIHDCEKKKVIEYVKPINDLFDKLDEQASTNIDSNFSDYVRSLKECADENIVDSYSKCPLYTYSEVEAVDISYIDKLIKAIETLLDAASPYKDAIEKELDRKSLIKLRCEFIKEKKKHTLLNTLINFSNKACKSVSLLLGQRSSAKQIQKCSMSKYFRYLYTKDKFDKLISSLGERTIEEETVFNKFNRKTILCRQSNKTVWKSDLKIPRGISIDYLENSKPSDAYVRYSNDQDITNKVLGDERFMLFFRAETTVLNSNNKPVSGGQKAEYILLRKLSDYKMYDVVLIDEMESSFDNPFLNTEVVNKIREIGQVATVFISTHNNNLGVSLQPNYYIYHEATMCGGDVCFKHYCGKANDEKLICPLDSKELPLSKTLLDTMEANEIAYSERKKKYDIA